MIKDNQRYLNRLHVVVDAVVTAASYLLAWWLMFGSRFADKEIGVLDMGIYFSALYFVVPGYLILIPCQLHRPRAAAFFPRHAGIICHHQYDFRNSGACADP